VPALPTPHRYAKAAPKWNAEYGWEATIVGQGNKPIGPKAGSDWLNIHPSGLRKILVWLKKWAALLLLSAAACCCV
jgi:hypothetical protein